MQPSQPLKTRRKANASPCNAPAGNHIFTAQSHREEPSLYIGKVAEMTGASRKAIRLYESLGLLPPLPRHGNRRVYSERDVFLVHMIKHAQSFGFSLMDLKEMLAEKVEKKVFPLATGRALIEKKRTELLAQIESLKELDRRLVELQSTMCRTFGQAPCTTTGRSEPR